MTIRSLDVFLSLFFRRFSALSIKVLLELCKDVSGDLALGKMLGEEHECQPLGGLCFILSCILRTAPEYTTWPWWLGRLLFLRKLMDEYITEFELSEDSPSPRHRAGESGRFSDMALELNPTYVHIPMWETYIEDNRG